MAGSCLKNSDICRKTVYLDEVWETQDLLLPNHIIPSLKELFAPPFMGVGGLVISGFMLLAALLNERTGQGRQTHPN
jgi:hypothetical protein